MLTVGVLVARTKKARDCRGGRLKRHVTTHGIPMTQVFMLELSEGQ